MECSLADGPSYLSHLYISPPSFFRGETAQLAPPPPAPHPLHQPRAGFDGYTESWSCSASGGGGGGSGGVCTFPDGSFPSGRAAFPCTTFPDGTLRRSFPSSPAEFPCTFPDGTLGRSFPSGPAAFPCTFPDGTLRRSFPSGPATFPCSNRALARHHLIPSHYPELMQCDADPGYGNSSPFPAVTSGYYEPLPPNTQYLSPENAEPRYLQTCKLSRLSLVGKQYALRIYEGAQLEEFILEKVRSRFLGTITSTSYPLHTVT